MEKNLRAPLAGIALAAERIDEAVVIPEVAMRTGDTAPRDRQRLIRRPPDLLITTPESLYLMLTSSAAETLAGVETVIVDEIHALAPTKRGAHLALSLERLEEITDRPPQRIGLSATQRPLEEVARFLGGFSAPGVPRPVTIVDAGIGKPLEVEVVIPVEDMGDMAAKPVPVPAGESPGGGGPRASSSIWPSIYPRILDQVLAHRSTIIFCNARRQAERLAAKLNELAEERGIGVDPETGQLREELVKAHHGSLAREQRVVVEDHLKRGELRAIVATSSLELGIDMGAVDLVIQVESPGAVSRGLQRIGRAGHQVGEPSKGSIYPKHRGDLLEAAVVVRRMLDGQIESTRYLRNPLDVLAQQIVAHTSARGETPVGDLAALVRRSANFAELSDEQFANTLDLLAGRYPSEEFSELRPRVVWNRVTDTVRARDGSKRLAVTSGGTIPDRGLFGVFLPDGTRVGELDEEMVYESRPGETFVLGASTWRIEDITFQKVTVTPAPGEPGKMPFWHGDRPGRPLELGRALGAFVRELRELPPAKATTVLRDEYALDALAASNLLQYVDEQAEATGVVPDDRTIVVERFRDEIGDWRICVLSPFGTPVHAPWAMAIERRLTEQYDMPVESMWGDDGIVLRLPEAADELPLDAVMIDPEDIEELVVATLPQTALFSSRFRECAGRALLLPRRRPDQRTPLWQQRQKAADLLAVAAKYPTFPILLEASRECLQDVFDVPALREVLGQLRSRAVRVVTVDTAKPSPMAQSLLFNWIAAYMYEGDAPLAERRAAALALDRDLLRDLLGAEELRELLDPGVLADVELDLQRLSDGRRARSADELHDVLRRVGDLTAAELDLRCEDPGSVLRDRPDRDGSHGQNVQNRWLAELLAEHRAIEIVVAGRDALRRGRRRRPLPRRPRLRVAARPARRRSPIRCPRPMEDLVGRYARTHGPFVEREVGDRFGVPEARVAGVLMALEAEGRVVRGEFRPEGVRREWCESDVLRQLRRRSLATLRREVEPVEPEALARFLPAWHGIPAQRRGVDAVVEALGLLAGAPIVASTLDADVLAGRVADYRPTLLDELCTSGDVLWVGAGAIGSGDGRVRLCFADQLPLLAPGWEVQDRPDGALHDAIRTLLGERGASFWNQLRAAAPGSADDELLAALWDLVWAGEVTNDSLAPAAGVHRARRSTRRAAGPSAAVASATWPAQPHRPAGRRRAVEPGGAVAGSGADADGVGARHGAAARRAPRRRHPRGRARRGRGRRLRVGVRRAQGARGAWPGAPRLLRQRARRSPVRPSRRRRPAASRPRAGRRRDRRGRRRRRARRARRHRSRPAVRGDPRLAGECRAAGPHRPTPLVVLRDGVPIAWYDRRSHHLVTFPHTLDDRSWAEALADLVRAGRLRKVEVRKVDGEPLATSPLVAQITAAATSAGFTDGYRGLTFHTADRSRAPRSLRDSAHSAVSRCGWRRGPKRATLDLTVRLAAVEGQRDSRVERVSSRPRPS